MSNIRSFHVVREKTDKEINFSNKIKKHRFSHYLRIIMCILVAVVIIVLLVYQYKNQIFTEIVVANKVERLNVSNTSYLDNDGNIVIYSKDGISSMDSKGKVLWNLTYEMQKPIVHRNGGIVAVCDYNGHIVYIIDTKGKVSQIDTNLPIRDFSVSKDSLVAAILEDSSNSWVNLYDATGTLLVEAKATMSKTGYPLAVTLSGEVMGVSYFYVDSNTMKSSITYYNFGGVGENKADHIVSSYDYTDAVVPLLQFMDEQTAFAVADNRLMFFTGSKKPTGTADMLLSENIQGVYSGGQYVGLVFFDSTGQCKYRIDIYDNQGKLVSSHPFNMDFKDILISNEQIMIYNESQCLLLNVNGKEKFSGEFNDNIIFMATTDSPRKFVVLTEQSLETIELK